MFVHWEALVRAILGLAKYNRVVSLNFIPYTI